MSKRPNKAYNTKESNEKWNGKPTGRKARRRAAKLARQEFVRQRRKNNG